MHPEPAPPVARGPRTDPDHAELLLRSGPVPLGYVSNGDSVYLVARERSAGWPIEILRAGTADLRIAGRPILRLVPELVTRPDEQRAILARFRAKYGEARFAQWYAHPARVLRLAAAGGSPPSADPSDRYHRWLEAEFDNVAEAYDHHITGNRVNRLLRDRSLAELRRAFASAHHLLEIGCGSGMETLPLLTEGHEILCLDISERMLEVVRAKARAAGVSEALRTVHLPAAALGRLLREVGAGSFEGAYSTYGALNCEADLSALPRPLSRLLAPGAPFVAGVYNRWCLFEILGYGITGKWTRALGRTRAPILVGNSRFCVDVYAFSVGEFRRQFAPWFRPVRTEAVPVVLPPSDLVRYAELFGHRWETLARWDRFLAPLWPFRYFGDHFLLTSLRTGSAD